MRVLRPLITVVFVVQVALPLALLVILSLGRDWFFPALLPAGIDGGAWRGNITGGRLLEAAVTSTLLGAACGVVATAVAVPAGRALARLRGPWLHVATAAAFLPIAAPPVAVATGLHVLLLRTGLGGSFGGVLLAHLVPATGYLTLYFLGVFAVWNSSIEEEARSLGASRPQTTWHVTLPLLLPALATAAILGFLISWAQVPLTLMIGAGTVLTLPVEVFAYAESGQDRYAAAGALLLTVPPLLLLVLAHRALARSELLPA